MRKIIKWSIGIVVLCFFLELGIGEYFYRIISTNNYSNGKPSLESMIQNGHLDTAWFNAIEKEELSIESDFNYSLSSLLLLNADSSDQTIIVNHGQGSDKYAMLKVAPMYIELGYNVLLFDCRGHGLSGGKHHSYGYYEKDDIGSVVSYVKERFPDGKVGLHGESMGAASVLLFAAQDTASKLVDFYVSDCAYSDLKTLFSYRLKHDFGLPNLLIIESASLMTRFHDGYFFNEVSPIADMKNITAPILFIHGKLDDYVPTFMGQSLHESKEGQKSLFLMPEAIHAASYHQNPIKYKLAVSSFINSL